MRRSSECQPAVLPYCSGIGSKFRPDGRAVESAPAIPVIQKFPFRIHTVLMDRGHEFQALFHWHLADQGIRYVYILARTPQLNGKVERSHRTDQQEFYQLLSHTDDVDLAQRLAE